MCFLLNWNYSSDLLLDVLRLVPHRDLGDPRQVNQGKVEDLGAVDLEVDWGGVDALVLPHQPLGVPADLGPQVADWLARAADDCAAEFEARVEVRSPPSSIEQTARVRYHWSKGE